MKRLVTLATLVVALALPNAAQASCWANTGLPYGHDGVVTGKGWLTCTMDLVANAHFQLQLYEGREWRAITEVYQPGLVWWDQERLVRVNWWCWTGTWRVVVAWDNISRSTFGNVVIGYPAWVGGC